MYVTFTVIPYYGHGVNNYVNFFMTATVSREVLYLSVEQTRCTFSHSIRDSDLGKLHLTGYMRRDCNIGANEAGKRVNSLFNYFSVMDVIKIN